MPAVLANDVTVAVKAVDFYAVEGQETAAVKIYREQGSDAAVRVFLDYAGSAASDDVETQPAFVDLAAGQMGQLVVLNPVSDTLSESTETLTIAVSADAAYSISSDRSAAHVFIRDANYLGDGVVAPLSETLTLHSLPGANHTIYLNFLGGDYSHFRDGNWDYVAPYDKDGDASTLSDEEKREIQKIWAAVSEDYLPFEINVTTELPPEGALTKISETDTTWGTSLLIGDDPGYGFAWSGSPFWESFEYPGYASINNGGGFWPLSTISSAASHEVGHTMGLNHHGGGGDGEYYKGHNAGGFSWSPVMGESNPNMHQWSKGEYPDANNAIQDDLAVISDTRNGFGYRIDDHADALAYATPLTTLDDGYESFFAEGIIESNTDIDWFTFQHPGGDMLLEISPSSAFADPNLDIGAKLYDANGQLLHGSDRTGNLSAGFSAARAAGTYYISIEGVGSNEGLGYTDYGSLGDYTITSGYGQLAHFSPQNEAANTPVAGSSQFSSVTISNLSSSGLGTNSSSDAGVWPLYWNISSSVNLDSYVSFSISPSNGSQVVLEALTVSFYAFSAATLHLRSSTDNFGSDVGQAVLAASTHNVVTIDLSAEERFDSSVEFRLYMTGSPGWRYLTGSSYTFDNLGQGLTVFGRLTESTDENNAPVLTLPADISVLAADSAGVPKEQAEISAFLSSASATDVLGNPLSVSNNAPNVFPVGATSVTFTATDAYGNTKAGTASVTVTLDTDSDGVPDGNDNCPTNSNQAQTDTDGDGAGDLCDDDDDNDGLSDTQESQLGTDPLLADTDGDGWSDSEEVNEGSDPLDASDAPTLLTQVVTSPIGELTVQLQGHSFRSAVPGEFEVLILENGQQSTWDPGPSRTYFGAVEGRSDTYAVAYRSRDGSLKTVVFIGRGVQWWFKDSELVRTKGQLDYGDVSFNYPEAMTLARGYVGDKTYEFGAGYELDYTAFEKIASDDPAVSGGAVSATAAAFESLEFTNALMSVTLTYSAKLRPLMTRVLIRKDAVGSPYGVAGAGGVHSDSNNLSELRQYWESTHADALGYTYRVALMNRNATGGVAYAPGRFATNNFGGIEEFHTMYVFLRHEWGHTFWVGDYDGGYRDPENPNNTIALPPEGKTIQNGNRYARWTGTALMDIALQRDKDLGTGLLREMSEPFNQIAMPPQAVLDLETLIPGKTYDLDVLANDLDANSDAMQVTGVAAVSAKGVPLSIVADQDGKQRIRYQPNGLMSSGFDRFQYQIEDATGLTGEGVVFVRVLGTSPWIFSHTDVDDLSHGRSRSYETKPEVSNLKFYEDDAWAEWHIQAPEAGAYQISVLYASTLGGQKLSVEVNDADAGTLTTSVTSVADNQDDLGFAWSPSFTVNLVAGLNRIRLSGVVEGTGIGGNTMVRQLKLEGSYDPDAESLPPYFRSDLIRLPDAMADHSYTPVETLAHYALDPNPSDELTFTKVTGPAWLQVASDGGLSGSPGIDDFGINQFTLRVTDLNNNAADATFEVPVLRQLSVSRYEIEDGSRHGVPVKSSNDGFSGSGYGDYDASVTDAYAEIVTDSFSEQVTIDLRVRYANGASDRPLSLSIDGAIQETYLSFPDTGGWTIWGFTNPVRSTLDAGQHTIRLTDTGASGGNLDYVEITVIDEPEEQVDSDADGVPDGSDNCPSISNADQVDTDSDQTGNACDDDDDNDGLSDAEESQLGTDPLLADTDGDGLSDKEESDGNTDPLRDDSDGDGVLDNADNCPLLGNAPQADADQDGFGNECDADDDNDGLSDAEEGQLGTNPLLRDTDGDGWSDKEEVDEGSDPLSKTSEPEISMGLPIWLLYQATQ